MFVCSPRTDAGRNRGLSLGRMEGAGIMGIVVVEMGGGTRGLSGR